MTNNTGQEPDYSQGDQRHVRARKRLWKAKRKLGNYRALAAQLDVNLAYLHPFVVHGIEPANPAVRVKLGLPKSCKHRTPARTGYKRSAWYWEEQLKHMWRTK